MIQLEWITNEVTKERRLFYRTITWRVDAAGAMSVMPVEWGPWRVVSERTMDEAFYRDLVESGGIAGAP